MGRKVRPTVKKWSRVKSQFRWEKVIEDIGCASLSKPGKWEKPCEGGEVGCKVGVSWFEW